MSAMRRRVLPLAAAAGAILAARLWVRIAPGSAVRWASRAPRLRSASRDERSSVPVLATPVLATVRATTALGSRWPLRASCLEQGIALVLLLAVRGLPARLVIGVARAGASLRAHAWVEHDGRVILGGDHTHGLTPLVDAPPALCHG